MCLHMSSCVIPMQCFSANCYGCQPSNNLLVTVAIRLAVRRTAMLRSDFSSAALLKRTTRTMMWTCTTRLRRSSCRRGGTHSLCWWHEDAPKWVFTRPQRIGLDASWTFSIWTTTIRRLTMSESPIWKLYRGLVECPSRGLCVL